MDVYEDLEKHHDGIQIFPKEQNLQPWCQYKHGRRCAELAEITEVLSSEESSEQMSIHESKSFPEAEEEVTQTEDTIIPDEVVEVKAFQREETCELIKDIKQNWAPNRHDNPNPNLSWIMFCVFGIIFFLKTYFLSMFNLIVTGRKAS